jgi:hypothetical protein
MLVYRAAYKRDHPRLESQAYLFNEDRAHALGFGR